MTDLRQFSWHKRRVAKIKKARKKRSNPEQRLQMAVAGYLRLALKPPTTWTSIGHGGGGKVRGALLKAAGVQPGWPDILIMHPGGHYRTLVVGIELKSAKGSVSDRQEEMMEMFLHCNAKMWVARSINDVESILRSMGIPLHARVSAALTGG